MALEVGEYCAAQEDRLGAGEVERVEGQVLEGNLVLQVDQNNQAEEGRRVKILVPDQKLLEGAHIPCRTGQVDSSRQRQDGEGSQEEKSDYRVEGHQVLDPVETRSERSKRVSHQCVSRQMRIMKT